MHIIKNKPDHFQVISGDDALTLPMVYLGGSGVISVIANSHPADYSTMVRAALNGEHELANSIHYKLIDIIEALFEEGSPAGVKAALNHFGICGPQVRLPLVSASAGLRKKIGNLIG